MHVKLLLKTQTSNRSSMPRKTSCSKKKIIVRIIWFCFLFLALYKNYVFRNAALSRDTDDISNIQGSMVCNL